MRAIILIYGYVYLCCYTFHLHVSYLWLLCTKWWSVSSLFETLMGAITGYKPKFRVSRFLYFFQDNLLNLSITFVLLSPPLPLRYALIVVALYTMMVHWLYVWDLRVVTRGYTKVFGVLGFEPSYRDNKLVCLSALFFLPRLFPCSYRLENANIYWLSCWSINHGHLIWHIVI